MTSMAHGTATLAKTEESQSCRFDWVSLRSSGAMPSEASRGNGSIAPSWAALAGIFRSHLSTTNGPGCNDRDDRRSFADAFRELSPRSQPGLERHGRQV